MDDAVPTSVAESELRELKLEEVDTPVRHLRIEWPRTSIKGRFAIGSSVPEKQPPLYDSPDDKDVKMHSASAVFQSKSSPVHVVVYVLQGSGTQTPHGSHGPSAPPPPSAKAAHESLSTSPVLVHARSTHGSVVTHVPQYAGKRPLHVQAHSAMNNVTVILPRSFNGVLSWKTESGSMTLSPEAVTRTSVSAKLGRSGTIKFAAESDLPSWMTGGGRRGDMCELSTKGGRLYVCMSGERSRENGAGCVIS